MKANFLNLVTGNISLVIVNELTGYQSPLYYLLPQEIPTYLPKMAIESLLKTLRLAEQSLSDLQRKEKDLMQIARDSSIAPQIKSLKKYILEKSKELGLVQTVYQETFPDFPALYIFQVLVHINDYADDELPFTFVLARNPQEAVGLAAATCNCKASLSGLWCDHADIYKRNEVTGGRWGYWRKIEDWKGV